MDDSDNFQSIMYDSSFRIPSSRSLHYLLFKDNKKISTEQ